MDFHKVRLRLTSKAIGSTIEIDGLEVDGLEVRSATSVTVTASVGEPTTVTLSFYADVDVDAEVDAENGLRLIPVSTR